MNRLGKNKLDQILSWTVLSLIGIFSCLYSLFWSNFSELNIQLSFLGFPVFISEIFLGFCLLALLVKWKISPVDFKPCHYLIFIYVLFILVKAFYGYFTWGPLAFRNAALFYYPLFAVIGYYFYRNDFFKNKFIRYGPLAALVGIIFLKLGYKTFYFTFFILTLFLFMGIKKKTLRYILITLFATVCYRNIMITIIGGKNILVSSLLGYLFISLIFISYFLKLKSKYRKAAVLLIIFFIPFSIWFVGGNQTAIKSLLDLKQISASYQEISRKVDSEKDNFEASAPPVKLYESNADFRVRLQYWPNPHLTDKSSENVLEKTLKFKDYEFRSIKLIQENILYRLFIWRDMFDELFRANKIFGLDFGKPFRSKTIEILKWDEGWKYRAGWVEPHNSYVHIIYRSGIIGVLFIIAILTLFIRMIIIFIRVHNFRGILLASIILYWLTISNFMVILELPHWAIPFWCLFGMVLRYARIEKSNNYLKNV